MSTSEAFVSQAKFYAKNHFPFGIERSGEFTILQAALLLKHGEAYQALHSNEREPINDEERAFVAVCAGEKEPASPHEKVWMRFCNKTATPQLVSSLVGATGITLNDDSEFYS